MIWLIDKYWWFDVGGLNTVTQLKPTPALVVAQSISKCKRVKSLFVTVCAVTPLTLPQS